MGHWKGPVALGLRSQWPRGAPRALILGPACGATQKPPALTANRERDREAPDQEGQEGLPLGPKSLKVRIHTYFDPGDGFRSPKVSTSSAAAPLMFAST